MVVRRAGDSLRFTESFNESRTDGLLGFPRLDFERKGNLLDGGGRARRILSPRSKWRVYSSAGIRWCPGRLLGRRKGVLSFSGCRVFDIIQILGPRIVFVARLGARQANVGGFQSGVGKTEPFDLVDTASPDILIHTRVYRRRNEYGEEVSQLCGI